MKSFMSFMLLFILAFNNLCLGGESLSDLTIDQNNLTNDLIASVVKTIYLETQVNFNKEIALFADTLKFIINDLGEYDEENALIFDETCQFELQRSIGRINTISRNSLRKYYDELKVLGVSYGLGVTDPIAQKLEMDINSIEFDMVSEMRGVLAMLQSMDELPSIGQQIQEGVYLYQKAASKEYATNQAAASQSRKSSWWKDLKATSNEFLGDFKVNLEIECKIAINDAADKTTKDIKKDATKQATTYAKSLTTPSKDTTSPSNSESSL